VAVSFRVNGETVSVNVPPEMPLLWVLRDVLELKGTKFGCGIAQCGACTVHMDGRAIRSCSTPVSRAEGADIRTVEGLSPDGTHALQEAWKELDVPQCGYCQAGQLMSAAALLEESPRPTDEDIDRAMDGNLCRCATYLRIRQAIHRAADTLAAEDAGGDGLDDRSGDHSADRASPSPSPAASARTATSDREAR